MAQLRDLAAGQSTNLPSTVLRARLTGRPGEASLSAVGSDDVDRTFRRVSSSEILVHPGKGSVTLVAKPSGTSPFPVGTRLGVDVRLEDHAEQQQVLVPIVDVGALAQSEVAHLEFATGVGWTVTAATGRPVSPGLSLQRDGSQRPAPVQSLDEQRYPWLSAGRYAFRAGRDGSPASPPTAVPWALVLDASLSMRTTFGAEGLIQIVELTAGVLAEWTGRMPSCGIASGHTVPTVVDEAVEAPRALAQATLDSVRPPSWSMLRPAVAEATRRGARLVAIITDGAPADTQDLDTLLMDSPETHVMVIATGQSRHGLVVEGIDQIEELGPLAELADAGTLRLIALGAHTIAGTPRAADLARAITQVAR